MKDLHFSRSFIKFWKSNVCVGKIQTYAEGDSGVTKQMKKAVSADSNTDKAKKNQHYYLICERKWLYFVLIAVAGFWGAFTYPVSYTHLDKVYWKKVAGADSHSAGSVNVSIWTKRSVLRRCRKSFSRTNLWTSDSDRNRTGTPRKWFRSASIPAVYSMVYERSARRFWGILLYP